MRRPFKLYKRCEKDGTKSQCATYPRCACDWYDRPREDGKRRWIHLPRTGYNKPFAYAQALKFRHDRQQIAAGLKPALKPPVPQLAALIAAYKKTTNVTGQKTNGKLVKALDSFLASVKDRPVDQVTATMIDTWRADLLTRPSKKTGGTWSRNTAQRVYNSVKGFFNWIAHRADLKALSFTNPCDELKDMSQDPAPRRLWRPDEQWLIDELPPLYGLPLKIGHLCGCRRAEALLLECHDLSPKGWAFPRTAGSIKLGWIAIQRKKKRGGLTKERIPIAATLVEELRKLIMSPFQTHIFGDPPPNPDAWSSLLTRQIRALGKAYNIDTRGLCMHGTRHTATTTMQDLPGVSQTTAQQMGGWTSTRMVETYSSPGEASMQVAAAGLAQAFKPRKPRGLIRRDA